jgi:hypothetical protein
MPGAELVRVRFTDGHHQQWHLPEGKAPDEVLEELHRVIVSGQWFRVPDGSKVYSPYAIVSVEITEDDADDDPSIARRLGEAVGEVIDPDRSGSTR